MIDRRVFVKSGLMLPAASLFGVTRGWGDEDTAAWLPLERFIFDPRFDSAVEIARHVENLGVRLSPVADDLMELWYEELDPLWKTSPAALAGVTLNETLFALETLGLDRRMRVVYRGRHSPVEDGRITHSLAGPAALIERLAAPTGADWHAALARALTACPLGKPDRGSLELVTDAPGLALRDETIYSWIIAPRAAVDLTIPS